MDESSGAITLLSAMITPAVLISACGTLIFSTSNRLARIVDRVRELARMVESQASGGSIDFLAEREIEMGRQLATYTSRGELIQRALTSLYLSLGMFVATTISIGMIALLKRWDWIPSALGITGTIILFYGCVVLVHEARLALQSVSAEMQFTLRLSELYRKRRQGP